MEHRKYSELIADWLFELSYTTCFFVAGGNCMHLLDAFRLKFRCVPVVHEVSAGIAAEYFNEVSENGKAFVLVTAGPGLTNLMTAIGGAWLESRELLVIGGQVKSTDLANRGIRQRGIQEIDGVALVESITKSRTRVTFPISRSSFVDLVEQSSSDRRGPCFIEICLDVQGMKVDQVEFEESPSLIERTKRRPTSEQIEVICRAISTSERPLLLFGGGLDRGVTQKLMSQIDNCGIPILTTWNGSDRYASDRPLWFGRPDTWGMRSANYILQRADLVVALGARLGIQQTGFNWTSFARNARVIHVDIDENELWKGHPVTTHKFAVDANLVLEEIVARPVTKSEWLRKCREIVTLMPLNDPKNSWHEGFVQPYDFVMRLANFCEHKDVVVPCSSGGANTVMMQAFLNKTGQYFFNNRALASMGYGLAGSIGAALARPFSRTVLVEGDGGFAQNLQELGTVRVLQPNLKIFLFTNDGYASIRMTQRNYFGGEYIGCDDRSGLGLPEWQTLSRAFGIRSIKINENFDSSAEFLSSWNDKAPILYLVPIHPEQTYYPKISSRIASDGSMESAPLDEMSPALEPDIRLNLE